jgi:hypothetical protein
MDHLKQLRVEQLNRVAPLIGPLLDAWHDIPNDIKSELPEFARHIRLLDRAMEGEGSSGDAR